MAKDGIRKHSYRDTDGCGVSDHRGGYVGIVAVRSRLVGEASREVNSFPWNLVK